MDDNNIQKRVIERCPTGITGFDNMCDGGFVRNSTVSILGGPGAGKTTFLLNFLWNGITKYNEKGMYISFESHDEDVFLDAINYGWDFKKLYDEGKFIFYRSSPKTNLKIFEKELTQYVFDNSIQRVCIDPVSILSLSLKDEVLIRDFVFNLTLILKRINITTLLSDETSEGTLDNFSLQGDAARTPSMKFLSDGLINLYSSGIGGESDRAIRIVKMRRTNHARGPIPFRITSKGFTVSYNKKRI